MLRIIFWQGLILLILFVLPGTSGAMSSAGAGSHSSGYESTGEQAKAELSVGESSGMLTPGPGLGAAVANYYSVIYEKEYYYRKNNSEPIRDYRYYKVKTIIPPSEKKNYVLRDFRREMWENKSYNK